MEDSNINDFGFDFDAFDGSKIVLILHQNTKDILLGYNVPLKQVLILLLHKTSGKVKQRL